MWNPSKIGPLAFLDLNDYYSRYKKKMANNTFPKETEND